MSAGKVRDDFGDDVVLFEPTASDKTVGLNQGVGMVVGPDGAASYWLPAPTGGYTTLHFSPSVGSPSNTWCMGVYHIPPGGRLPERNYERTLAYYTVIKGEAHAELASESTCLGVGDSVYIERCNAHAFENTGDQTLELLWQTWSTGPDLFIESCGLKRDPDSNIAPSVDEFDSEAAKRWASERDWWVRPMSGENRLHSLSDHHAGVSGEVQIIRKDDGSSDWSPGEDMQGFLTQKVTPFNTRQHQFGIHWQYLHHGKCIPPHMHSRNEEMLFIVDGEGYAEFEDFARAPLRRGSAVWVGRHVKHTLVSNPNDGMNIQFTITPPSLDVFFSDMGEPRNPEDPQRDAFPINEAALPSLERSWIPVEEGESRLN